MARKGGLGRGLTSLIPTTATEDDGPAIGAQPGLQEVPVDAIRPNPHQPRRSFDEDTLDGLVESHL